MRLFIYSLIFQLLFTCNSSEESSKVDHKVYDLSLLKKSIVLKGDVNPYNELSTWYTKREKYLDFLPYTFLMANEYHYYPAFYDVFYYLYLSSSNECYDYDLSCLDNQTKKIALKYLILGIEKGDESCSYILLNFYDKDKHYPIKELYTNIKLIEKAKLNTVKID